jgi:mannitol 2-dehydrogenase
LKDQREEEEEGEGGEGGAPRLSHARSIVDAAKANAAGATVCTKFHSNSSAAEEEAEAPLIIGMRRGKSFSVSLTAQELAVDQEENWLKFYVNPFAELLDKKCQSLPLSTENLETILQRNFKGVRGKGPTYDRSFKNYSRICHVGVGGFHRSHQAVYTDDLLELTRGQHAKAKAKGEEDGDRWAICGVGLMVWDKKMYESLKEQDYMYTVLFRSQEGNDARVVGSILDFVFAPEDYQTLFRTLADPSTRIVSLTITEKGYCQKVDGNLNTDDVNVKHDLTDLSTPRTALGMLCGALDQRRREGRKSFTVLSCDNQPDNGHQLEKLVKQMAVLAVGEELKEWIEANTTFPNTMVVREEGGEGGREGRVWRCCTLPTRVCLLRRIYSYK